MDKKKVISFGSILLGLTLTTSILSTVAWYNGSSYLQVKNFNIEFANKELSISTDNTLFKNTLTNDDLNEVKVFKPVSSTFSSLWLNEKAEMPTFYKGPTGSQPNKQFYDSVSDFEVADSGFLSQTLYLKCDATGNVSIDPLNTYIEPNHEANDEVAYKIARKYPGIPHDTLVKHLDSIVDSIRLSVLVLDDEEQTELDDYKYYIINPTKDSANPTYLGGIMDSDFDGYYDFYDGKEIFYGEREEGEQSDAFYQTALESEEDIYASNSVFDAITKQGVQHFDQTESENAGFKVAQEKSLSIQEASENVSISLKSGVSKRIVLSLYLEGWDKDNTNFVMYSHFRMNLSFCLASEGKGGN